MFCKIILQTTQHHYVTGPASLCTADNLKIKTVMTLTPKPLITSAIFGIPIIGQLKHNLPFIHTD